MDEYPKGSTARVYYDSDNNPVPLNRLVRDEPEWAVNRIRYCEDYEQLQATNRQLVEALEGLVNTKDYKDKHGKDQNYNHMRVVAWSKAHKALTNAKQREEA